MVNVIDYITIATTGNATDFGDLSTDLTDTAGVADTTRGCIGGGSGSGGYSNAIGYITIDTTGNTTDFGDITVARSILGGLTA